MVQFRKPLQRILTHFLAWFFKLLYTRLAWSYDLVSFTVSLGQWNHWVQSVIQLAPCEPILELGHGTGHLQTALFKAGFHPFAMDISSHMGHITRGRILKFMPENHIRSSISPGLSRARAQALPFAANTFKTIFSTFPSPYIVDPDTVREIQRVLLPHGQAIILLSAWITGKKLPDLIARWLFALTNQTPSSGMDYSVFLAPFQLPGQRAELVWLEPAGSRLMLVRITKELPRTLKTR